MSDTRLYRESITLGLAFVEAFADWQNPTAAELNNTDLVKNITCALNEDGTTFNLADSDTDDTITFCESAGSVSPTRTNVEVVYEAERSEDPTASNQANEAFGLMAFPDIEYYAILRVGHDSDVPFAVGQRVSLVRVGTDLPVDVMGGNENIRIQQNFLAKGDINWNYEVAA